VKNRPSPVAMNALRPCDLCHQPVAGSVRGGMKTIDFYVLKVERHLVDQGAVRRHVGLTMQLGNELLAHAMGTAEPATKPFSHVEVFVCQPCMIERHLGLIDEGVGKDLPFDPLADGR
jgi:hypothetical protein